MLVDMPDAVLRARIDDLLSSSLQTYRGLVVFLPLMMGCEFEAPLWPFGPLVLEQFDIFLIGLLDYWIIGLFVYNV
jgi:hypothetical protein